MQSPSHTEIDEQPAAESDSLNWLLVACSNQSEVELAASMPFTVGRRAGCSLQINRKTISGVHAELRVHRDALWIRDLESTNGTFVNGTRISQPVQLKETDLVQFADDVYRVHCEPLVKTCATMAEDVCDSAYALMQFDRLMVDRLVCPNYQPVVNLQSSELLGYEVLARSRLHGLESPRAMFSSASRLNMEVQLSRMLRWEGVRQAAQISTNKLMFVNTHPLEVRQEGLIESLTTLRDLAPERSIVLEVHEAAITEPREMQRLKSSLTDLQILLAYDDFGAGQARLSELVAAPPDFLKFDISLVRGIDKASDSRRKMIKSLLQMALDLGINALAEGVERQEEAEVCKELGFLTAQGYAFGHPKPLEEIVR